jgi:hypothetical protein
VYSIPVALMNCLGQGMGNCVSLRQSLFHILSLFGGRFLCFKKLVMFWSSKKHHNIAGGVVPRKSNAYFLCFKKSCRIRKRWTRKSENWYTSQSSNPIACLYTVIYLRKDTEVGRHAASSILLLSLASLRFSYPW